MMFVCKHHYLKSYINADKITPIKTSRLRIRITNMLKIIVRPDLLPYFPADRGGFNTIMLLTGKSYTAAHKKHRKKIFCFSLNKKMYFAKLYCKNNWWKTIKYLLQCRISINNAHNEWQAIQQLQAIGIKTPAIAAYGYKKIAFVPVKSLIITEALSNAISLEELCAPWQQQPPSPILKRQLIIKLATSLQHMHAKGISHGDSYLRHFYLTLKNKESPSDLVLSIIDLEFARIKKHTSKHYRIKDLRKLYASCLKIDLPLTQKDIFRFIRAYRGKPLRNIFPQEKNLWKTVERKAKQSSFLLNNHVGEAIIIPL